MKLSTHDAWPYIANCPVTKDTLHEKQSFISSPTGTAVFHACTKHVLTGNPWNFVIKNSGNVVVDSWSYSSLSNKLTSYLGWTRSLPQTPGVYTYEGTFNGITCAKSFTIQGVTNVNEYNNSSNIKLFPNPSKGKISIQINDDLIFENGLDLMILNSLGQEVKSTSFKSSHSEIELNLSSGLYLYKISNSNKLIKTGKLLIE